MTPETEKTLLIQYAGGANVRTLATNFGVSIQTVYNVLERQGKGTLQRKGTAIKEMIRARRAGATVEEIAKRLDVSISTVTRVMRTKRIQGEGIPTKRGRPPVAKIPHALASRRAVPIKIDLAQVDEVYAAIYKTPFPYPEPLSQEAFTQEVTRLKTARLFVDDNDTIRPWTHVGARACASFFPNRYAASKKNTPSAVYGWRDEKLMRKAITFQLRHGDPVTPKRVLRAMTLLCRTPTVFRPAIARFICEKYCPPGGVVWDPCSGYGGRLLGAHAAGVHYIGTDVEIETISGNRRLAEALGASHDLFVTPAEDFSPPPVDLVFTSPPYFDCERYSQAEEQSWKKYRDLGSWIDGFMRPVMTRARAALRSGYLILNVADFRERKQIIPIVDRTISAAIDSGFAHVQTLQMPLASINRRAPIEPILIFR